MAESSAEGSKPPPSELLLVDSTEMKLRQHLQMKPAIEILLQNGSFLDFVENASQEVVVHFFSESAHLYPGNADSISAGECVLREFSEQQFIQCSLDTKARLGFIIMPLRHVEKLGNLDDQELFALWSVGVRALKSEGLSFTNMIVNHGSYRNLPHLHLKIWVDEREFGKAVVKWRDEKKMLWSNLQWLTSVLTKKCVMCVVIQKGRKYRFGERCSATAQSCESEEIWKAQSREIHHYKKKGGSKA